MCLCIDLWSVRLLSCRFFSFWLKPIFWSFKNNQYGCYHYGRRIGVAGFLLLLLHYLNNNIVFTVESRSVDSDIWSNFTMLLAGTECVYCLIINFYNTNLSSEFINRLVFFSQWWFKKQKRRKKADLLQSSIASDGWYNNLSFCLFLELRCMCSKRVIYFVSV